MHNQGVINKMIRTKLIVATSSTSRINLLKKSKIKFLVAKPKMNEETVKKKYPQKNNVKKQPKMGVKRGPFLNPPAQLGASIPTNLPSQTYPSTLAELKQRIDTTSSATTRFPSSASPPLKVQPGRTFRPPSLTLPP